MSDRYAMCPRCGRRLHRKKDIWGDWDGETYVCEHCAAEADDDDFEEDDEQGKICVILGGGNKDAAVPFL